jgi:hypothetical protein
MCFPRLPQMRALASLSPSPILLASCLLALASPLLAQSGRASLHGWVAFENVAYVDSQPRATVELRREAPDSAIVYSTVTDGHGFFSFEHTSLGPFVLRITAPHFRPYSAGVYLASDFAGNWAVQLKASD